jgi:hypothetical protein
LSRLRGSMIREDVGECHQILDLHYYLGHYFVH